MNEKSYVSKLVLIGMMYHTDASATLLDCKKFIEEITVIPNNKFGVEKVPGDSTLFLASAAGIHSMMRELMQRFPSK